MKTRRPPERADRGGHMSQQRGLSLMGLIVTLAVVGFLGVTAARLLPAYIEYWSVRKIFAAMVQNGDTNGTVTEIRRHYDTRNAIEDVKNVQGKDLEITKEGGETVVAAEWSVKVPLVANVSACIDFSASTANQQ
jgi:Tfp pilus assembly protein PilE